MRTTIDLDPDVHKLVRDTAHKEHRSTRAVVNEGLRDSLGTKPAIKRKKITLPTYDMGEPLVDLTKALALASDLEDEEIIRKMALGK